MRKLLILTALAGLTGCTPPVYGKSNFLNSPGYSDKSLGEGVWEVTFRTTGGDRENRYLIGALYRSAELARQAGFPFFQVVRFQGWTKTQRFAGTPLSWVCPSSTSPGSPYAACVRGTRN
jgi:hypothetical protein